MGLGYRDAAHVKKGFNMAVVDVDDGVDIDTAKLLLSEYKYLIHTTKRHTKDKHRFRIIFPLSHIMKLHGSDYKEFMNNIYEWLPFGVDSQTNDPARKWLAGARNYWYNDGELLDALQFIPKTKKNDERKVKLGKLQSLDAMQKWFVTKTDSGNRNNQLIRYALMLVDSGRDIANITTEVMTLNSKLPDPISEDEILATVIRTVSKKISQRDEP